MAHGGDRPRLRVLIVDDEPLAREGLRRLLAQEKDIVIVGECGDGVTAVAAVTAKRPDLVFLDIQMPEMDGFDVLRTVGAGTMPAVVFVTEYDAYALRAFEVHAVDYLLKPVDPQKFSASLDHVRTLLRRHVKRAPKALVRSQVELLSDFPAGKQYLNRLVVKSGRRVVILQTSLVDWVEANGDYVTYHAQGKKYLVREKIGSIEHKLNPAQFVRIHRSSIVNIERIRELEPRSHGEHTVILADGTRLTLSRGYRETAFRQIGGSP